MRTNTHIIVALLVTPVLAVLAWFAMDRLVGEQARPAQPGQSYPLVEQSNCRYPSGRCELRNEDFSVSLSIVDQPGVWELQLTASHALDGVLLSVTMPAVKLTPVAMQATDESGMHWRIAMARPPREGDRIRLALRAGGSAYFGETAVDWTRSQRVPEVSPY